MGQHSRRDLFPGALELMILRSLESQSLHGYALASSIKRRSNDALQVEEGSLYPALQRLLKAGMVSAEWEVSSTNRRVRTYSLSSKGKKHLKLECARFEEMLVGVKLVLSPNA